MKDPIIEKAIKIAGGQAALAEKAGCSQPAISKLLLRKSKRPSVELAMGIDRATDGQVSKYVLRPDIFGPLPVEPLPENADVQA